VLFSMCHIAVIRCR